MTINRRLRRTALAAVLAAGLTAAAQVGPPPPGIPGAVPGGVPGAPAKPAAEQALHDAWYKIVASRITPAGLPEMKHIGFLHDKIVKATSDADGKPVLRFESILEMDGLDGRPPVSLLQTGDLTDSYRLIEASVSYATQQAAPAGGARDKFDEKKGPVDVTIAVEMTPSDQAGKHLFSFTGDAGGARKEWIAAEPDLAPFGGILGRIVVARKFLETADAVVNLKTFDLSGGSPAASLKIVNKGNDGGKKKVVVADKEIPVWELEAGFPFRERSESWQILVDAQGKALEINTRGWRASLAADEKDAKGGEGRYRLTQRGRRDPLRKDLVLTPVGSTPKGGPIKTGVDGPVAGSDVAKTDPIKPKDNNIPIEQSEEFKRRLTQFNAKYALIHRLVEEGKTDKLLEEYGQFSKLFREMRMVAQDQTVIKDIEDKLLEINKIYPGALRALQDAQRELETLKGMFDAKQFDGLKAQQARLEQYVNHPAVADTPEKAKIQDLAKEGQALVTRAERILEFQRESIDLTGLVYNLEVRPFTADAGVRVLAQTVRFAAPLQLPVSNSYAILNGRILAEGEDVKADLTVRRVERDGVVFLYKGEEVKRFLVK